MTVANQSIAQLSQQLQTALGNAQTMVAFRISRADAEVLARVLSYVDSGTIRREAQTPVQHPIYTPLAKQWESFIQALTTQAVRQCMIKTADDRLGIVWAEEVLDGIGKANELE